MTVFESWQYGDPEKVAIRKQEEALRKVRACGQCVHKTFVEWNGLEHFSCEFKRRFYGTRCELYRKRIA